MSEQNLYAPPGGDPADARPLLDLAAARAWRAAHLRHEAYIQGMGALWGLASAGLGLLTLAYGVFGVRYVARELGTGRAWSALVAAWVACAALALVSSLLAWLAKSLWRLRPPAKIGGVLAAALISWKTPAGATLAALSLALLLSKRGRAVLSEEGAQARALTPELRPAPRHLLGFCAATLAGAAGLTWLAG